MATAHSEPADATLARNSVAVAFWTAVSRTSGFVRIAVVAAVLGPTYLGNIYQATNNLPNLTYMALTGALLSNLLVPALVRHVDGGDRAATQRLARAFLSVVLALFAAVALLVAVAAPLLLRVLSLGVTSDAAAAAQRGTGLVLLLLFLPQLLLYGVVGTAEAVMNAHGRFALAAAAPTLENVGIVATMVAAAALYGTGDTLTGAPLYLLGIGTTSAVALHAAVQWWGASRVGVRLRPGPGWRDPEVRAVVRRAVPSLGYSTMDVLRPFGAIVVANRVPGGVVAFDFAYNFYLLPTALGARPVSVALLPRLSRLFVVPDARRFRDELVGGARLVALLAVPAAVALAVLAGPIASAVSFGQMGTGQGRGLLAAALHALGPGVIGAAALLLGTYACYARRDPRTPVVAMGLRTAVAALGMALAFVVPAGAAALVVLGLTVAVADLAGGARLAYRLRRELPAGGEPLVGPVARTVAASVLMVLPAYACARRLPLVLPDRWGDQVAMLVAAVAGLITYLLLQRWWRAPELALLRDGLPAVRPRSRPTPARGLP